MTIPKTDEDAWRDAIGTNDARAAVRALVEAWQVLASASSANFNADLREPKVTELLATYLASTREASRLTGLWTDQMNHARLTYGSQGFGVEDRRRTDVTYFSNNSTPALHLIFEFKRLDGSLQANREYEGEGMLRFVNGSYGENQRLGMMVGMLVAKMDDCVTTLISYLEASSSIDFDPPSSQRIRSPSDAFPDICQFDTQHKRSGIVGPIMLSHLFLRFPKERTRRARTSKRRT